MKRGSTSQLPAGRRTLARLTLGAWGLWGAAASLSLGAGCSDGRGVQGATPAAPAQSAAAGEGVLPVSAYVVHRDKAAGLPNLAWLEAKRAVAPGAPAAEAAEIIERHKFGCLPVVENGKLVGILTEADFLKFARRYLEAERSQQA